MYIDYYRGRHGDPHRGSWFGRGRPWRAFYHGEPYGLVAPDPRVSWPEFWRTRRVEPPAPRDGAPEPPMRQAVPAFQPQPPLPPPKAPDANTCAARRAPRGGGQAGAP